MASDVGALGATVQADQTGWVVPPGSPAALADAIRSALDDEASRSAMGARAAAIAEERSPERVAARLRETYEAVVAAA